MLPHVPLQSICSSTGVAALVTFERFLSCVLSHHVKFQFCSFNARIIARCAPVWFFTRVPLLVYLQAACLCSFVVTLIAFMLIFTGVLLDVRFEVKRLGAREVASIAIVQFFFIVLPDMSFEVGSRLA